MARQVSTGTAESRFMQVSRHQLQQLEVLQLTGIVEEDLNCLPASSGQLSAEVPGPPRVSRQPQPPAEIP